MRFIHHMPLWIKHKWWIGMELNHRRAGLQPTALPIELPILKLGLTVSIELTTCCLHPSRFAATDARSVPEGRAKRVNTAALPN